MKEGECNVHSPISTSGVTCADLLMAGIAAGHFPTCISRGGAWPGFKWAITQTEDDATFVQATLSVSVYLLSNGLTKELLVHSYFNNQMC